MKDPDTIAREFVEYAMALFDEDGDRVTTARQAGLRERIAAVVRAYGDDRAAEREKAVRDQIWNELEPLLQPTRRQPRRS